MHTGHQLTDDERKKHLERNCFACPELKARISPFACAAQRKRPAEERPPACGDDCATWVKQRDKFQHLEETGDRKRRATCGFCGRANMTLPRLGLCGTCCAQADKGLIAPGEDGTWSTSAQRGAARDALRNSAKTRHKAAWRLLLKGAGCASQAGLAKRLGCSRKWLQVLLDQLAQGHTPKGPAYAKLLQVTGTSTEELLQACGRTQATAKDMATDISTPPPDVPPASPSLPPSGPVATSSAGPEGPATNAEPEKRGAAITTPWGQFTAAGQALGLVAAEDAAEAPDLAGDFERYTGARPLPQPSEATVSFNANGAIVFSAGAVRSHGLDQVERIALFWSGAQRAVSFLPGDCGDGSRKVSQPKRDCQVRCITARGFRRQYGIDDIRGSFPLAPGPGGLLVATINAPAQGGEG